MPTNEDDDMPTLHSIDLSKLGTQPGTVGTPAEAPPALGAEPPAGTAPLPALPNDFDVEVKTRPTVLPPVALQVDAEVDLPTRQVSLPASMPAATLRLTAPMGFAAGLVVGCLVAAVVLNLVRPPPGHLSIVTDRSTTLRIGEQIYGYGPLRNVDVAAGKQELTLVEPSGAMRHLTVEIRPGETLSLKLNVDSLPR